MRTEAGELQVLCALPCPACTARAQGTALENICWRVTVGSAPARLSCGVWGGLEVFFSCEKLEEERWSSGTKLRSFPGSAQEQNGEDKKGSGEG